MLKLNLFFFVYKHVEIYVVFYVSQHFFFENFALIS